MTQQPFLALITPIGEGGGPVQPPSGGPPGVWQPTFPTNPIARPPWGWGQPNPPPLGIWGGGGIGNYPDAGFPGPQPGGPVYPSHPIYYPPVISGGPIDPYPDIGGPAPQPPPGSPPPRPTHPIYYPPRIWGGPIDPYPDIGFPGPQPGGPVRPTHPIYYPPVISGGPIDPYPDIGGPGPQPEGPKIEWKTAWSPSTGWIVVGVPTGEHVTPSSGEEPKT